MTFMTVWIGYAVIGVLTSSLAFIWAVRTGQFSNMDHARYIALKAEKPVERETADKRVSRLDWVSLCLMIAATLLVIVSTIFIGIRCLINGRNCP